MKNFLIVAVVVLVVIGKQKRDALLASITGAISGSPASPGGPALPYGGGADDILGDEVPFQGSGFGGGGNGVLGVLPSSAPSDSSGAGQTYTGHTYSGGGGRSGGPIIHHFG